MLHNNGATNNWQPIPPTQQLQQQQPQQLQQQQHQQQPQQQQQHLHQQQQQQPSSTSLASKLFQQQPTTTLNQNWPAPQQQQQHHVLTQQQQQLQPQPEIQQKQLIYNNYFAPTEYSQDQMKYSNQTEFSVNYYQQQQQPQQPPQQQQHPHPQHSQPQQPTLQTNATSAHENFENNNISITNDGWDDWEWNDTTNNNSAEATTLNDQAQQIQHQQQIPLQQQQQQLPLQQHPQQQLPQQQQQQQQPPLNSSLIEDSFNADSDGNWSWNNLNNVNHVTQDVTTNIISVPPPVLSPLQQQQQPQQQPQLLEQQNIMPQVPSYATLENNKYTNNNNINNNTNNDVKHIPEINATTTNNTITTTAATVPIATPTNTTAATNTTGNSNYGVLPSPPLPQQIQNITNLEIGVIADTITPPKAFQNTAGSPPAATVASTEPLTTIPYSAATAPPPPPSIQPPTTTTIGVNTSGNPFKRAGPAQYHRTTGLLATPSTTTTTTATPPPPPQQQQPTVLGLASNEDVNTPQMHFANIPYDNADIYHENQEVVLEPTPTTTTLEQAPTLPTQITLPGGSSTAGHTIGHIATHANDERAQYLQTSHLSEHPDGEANLEIDNQLPPPGLSRLVPLGQPELVETQRRMVTGTEQPSVNVTHGNVSALHMEERQADGEDTSDEQSTTAISSTSSSSTSSRNNSNNLPITTDRNLYLVAGESNGNEQQQQRVVTGVETTTTTGQLSSLGMSVGNTTINHSTSAAGAGATAVTATPTGLISEQREIVLDGENLEDQQQQQQQQLQPINRNEATNNANNSLLGAQAIAGGLATTTTTAVATNAANIGNIAIANNNHANVEGNDIKNTSKDHHQQQQQIQHVYQHSLSNNSGGNDESEPHQRNQPLSRTSDKKRSSKSERERHYGQTAATTTTPATTTMLTQQQQQQQQHSSSSQYRERKRNSDRFESEESEEYINERERERERERTHNRRRSFDDTARYSDADERAGPTSWRGAGGRSGGNGDKDISDEFISIKTRKGRSGGIGDKDASEEFVSLKSRKGRRQVSSRYRHYADDETEESIRQGESGGAGSGADGSGAGGVGGSGGGTSRRSKANNTRRIDNDYDDSREQRYHARRDRGERYADNDERDRRERERRDRDPRTRRGYGTGGAYYSGDYNRSYERRRGQDSTHYRDEIEYEEYRRRSSRNAREEREREREVYNMAMAAAVPNTLGGLNVNKMRQSYDVNMYSQRLYEKIMRNPQVYQDLCAKFYNELESMPSPRSDKVAMAHEAKNAAAAAMMATADGHESRDSATGIAVPTMSSLTDGRESRQSGCSSMGNNDKERSGLETYTPNWPLKFNEPHMFVRFCADKCVTIEPRKNARGQIEYPMNLYKLSEQSDNVLYSTYPGPLIENESFTEKIIAFCEERIRAGPPLTSASIYAKPTTKGNSAEVDLEKCRASHRLLWSLLIQMMRQKGRIDGTDVANLLSKNEEEFPYANDELIVGGTTMLHGTDAATANNGSMDSLITPAKATDKFRKLLTVGNKSDALDWATEHQMWGHALYIASRMDNRTHASVLKRFAHSNIANNDPLLTLYQVLSNHTPTAVTSLHNEKWGDWRPHFAMIITNTSHNPELGCKAIAMLGDSLFQRGDIYAAHFAYILANVNFAQHDVAALEETNFKPHLPKLVLLGSSHYKELEQFATDEAIIMTEVYEYARSLNEHNYSIVSLQYYKYLFTIRLLDSGYTAKALLYLEQIALHIQRDPSKYTRTFIKKICNLAECLRYIDPLLQKPLDETHLSYNSALNYAEQPWLSNLRLIYDEHEQNHGVTLTSATTAANTNPAQINQAFVELNKQFNELNMQYADNNTNDQNQQQQHIQQQQLTTEPTVDATQSHYYDQQQQQQQNVAGVTADLSTYGQHDAQHYDAQQQQHIAGDNNYGLATATQYEQQTAPLSFYDPTQQQQSSQQQHVDTATDAMAAQQNLSVYGAGQGGYDYWSQQQQQLQPDGDEKALSMSQAAQPTISLPRSKTYESDEDDASHGGAGKTQSGAKQDGSGKDGDKSGSQQLGGGGAAGNQQNASWVKGIWNKITLKPKNQMILPDDKNPTIVWDADKQRWVNKDGDESEEHSLRPPPKMSELAAAMGGINVPSAGIPQAGQAPPLPQQQQQLQQQLRQQQQLRENLAPASQTMHESSHIAPPDNYYGNSDVTAAAAAAVPALQPTAAPTPSAAMTAPGQAAMPDVTPKLQSNAFKAQRYRKLKNSYVDVFNPSGAPLKNTAENVMAPAMPPMGMPQGGFLIPGAPVQQQQQQQQQQSQDGFY